jgi:hypothetical protein
MLRHEQVVLFLFFRDVLMKMDTLGMSSDGLAVVIYNVQEVED